MKPIGDETCIWLVLDGVKRFSFKRGSLLRAAISAMRASPAMPGGSPDGGPLSQVDMRPKERGGRQMQRLTSTGTQAIRIYL